MVKLFNQLNAGHQIDYITLNGDLLAHGVSGDLPADPKNPTAAEMAQNRKHYAVARLTHKIIQGIFTEAFPNTPVFVTFGNNDTLYHNNPAWANNATAFYTYMYNLWFVQHAPNRQFQAQVKQTFLHGGYYTVDLKGGVSLLSINTMNYMNGSEQSMLGSIPQDQSRWVESVLA